MRIPSNLSQYTEKGLLQDELVILEESLGFSLPRDYHALLLASNGMSIGGGILIYGSDILAERNTTWEVAEYTPGYIAIGDSGEGRVFLMSLDSSDASIYEVDSGVMDVEFMNKVGSNLEEWMANGCPFKS